MKIGSDLSELQSILYLLYYIFYLDRSNVADAQMHSGDIQQHIYGTKTSPQSSACDQHFSLLFDIYRLVIVIVPQKHHKLPAKPVL